jgi:hypothetical protein
LILDFGVVFFDFWASDLISLIFLF